MADTKSPATGSASTHIGDIPATTTLSPRTIRLADLPNAGNIVFRDTAFFKKNCIELPTPAEVRQRGIEVNGYRARLSQPPTIQYEDLGLVVKYGADVSIGEAQCLWYFNNYMKDTVPTPELFGWYQDDGKTFIFMELIPGDTLEDVWPSLNQQDRDAVYNQLHTSVQAWRSLRQEKEPYYLGHIGRQGISDIIFSDAGSPNAGPFKDITKFHDFFARFACQRRLDLNPREFEELVGLTDDTPVVFTHGDLDKSNIMIAPREKGSLPRVAAIIDWHQSGWYPRDWEWLKAASLCQTHRVGDKVVRDISWVSKIVDPADEAYMLAWGYVMATLGYPFP